MEFDYELEQKKNFTASLIDYNDNVSNARITKADGTMSNLTVSIFGDKYYNSDIIKQNSFISFVEFTILVDTEYSNINITLTDEDNNPVYEENGNLLNVFDLIDQKYYVTIICYDSYSEMGSKVFIQNTLTITFAFFIDTTAPTGKIYNENGDVITSSKTNSNYITFVGEDKYSGLKSMYYIDQNNNKVIYNSSTKITNDGTYSFYCVDNAGNNSLYYTITLDKTKPSLLFENAIAYSDTNNSFTVYVQDSNTTHLYYKNPVMSIYSVAVNNKYTVTKSMPKGIYYFYAIDNFNNKTNEVWVNYGGGNSIIRINHIDNSNSVYLSWEISDLNVLLNNENYTKENIISNEGNYEVTVIDKENNISKIYFEIDCYYVIDKVIESSCSTEGYTIYRCISCDNIKYDDYTTKGNHKYNNYQINPTCINGGGICYYCVYCNYNYSIYSSPPLGHNYEYTIIDSTCYEEGKRIIECTDCNYYIEEEIPIKNHKLILLYNYSKDDKIINQYMCEHCLEIFEKEANNKSELFINFVNFLQTKYFPYMVWILLASVGIWSIIIGIRIIFLKNSDEQFVTKNMIKNYIFGLITIFILIVCIPIIINGISKI